MVVVAAAEEKYPDWVEDQEGGAGQEAVEVEHPTAEGGGAEAVDQGWGCGAEMGGVGGGRDGESGGAVGLAADRGGQVGPEEAEEGGVWDGGVHGESV